MSYTYFQHNAMYDEQNIAPKLTRNMLIKNYLTLFAILAAFFASCFNVFLMF